MSDIPDNITAGRPNANPLPEILWMQNMTAFRGNRNFRLYYPDQDS